MSSTIIDRIKERLLKYPSCRYEATSSSLTIHAEVGGFDVGVHLDNHGFTVSFDGWHEHFATEDEALECFAFGLSDACRLEVSYRGELPTSWTVQTFKNGEWISESTTGLLLVPFWRSKSIRHLQNHLIRRTTDESRAS